MGGPKVAVQVATACDEYGEQLCEHLVKTLQVRFVTRRKESRRKVLKCERPCLHTEPSWLFAVRWHKSDTSWSA